jgi:hypothetical protein
MDFEAAKIHVENTYKVIEFNQGHYKTVGTHAYFYKNPFWRVINEKNEEMILMFCEKNTICNLCPTSFQKILEYEAFHNVKITWFVAVNGYMIGNNKLYMHQVIMDCYGNGKGTKGISVDHVDRNKLNNCYNNLRIATFEEQHSNCKGIISGTKRERKHSAKELPEGISHNMMKKYVVYYQEWLDKEHTKQREYFKVEKHPKLAKIWIGSKSNKVTIQEKLQQANKIVDDLENDIYPIQNEINLPKYVSLVINRENHI